MWAVAVQKSLSRRQRSEDVVVGMVELTHQAVDVGRGVPADVGDEQGNELGGHVVKHRAMDTDFLQNVP